MKYYRKLQAFLKRIGSYRVPIYAANAAFYIILSVFPAIMLVVGLLPYIGYSEQDLLLAIGSLMPEVLEPLLARIISDMSANSTSALISVTAIVAVWSSSRGVYCIQLGLNAIHGAEESRSYLYRRLMSMLYMVLLIAALLLTLVMHGFGQEVAAFCERKSVPILHLFAKLLQFRELIVLVLLTILFTVVFRVFPNCKVPLRSALIGAICAALGWLVFTYGFSFYVRISGSYSVLYGSLSIIAIGMLWLYICICILFYGSVLGMWLEERHASKKA